MVFSVTFSAALPPVRGHTHLNKAHRQSKNIHTQHEQTTLIYKIQNHHDQDVNEHILLHHFSSLLICNITSRALIWQAGRPLIVRHQHDEPWRRRRSVSPPVPKESLDNPNHLMEIVSIDPTLYARLYSDHVPNYQALMLFGCLLTPERPRLTTPQQLCFICCTFSKRA